MNELPEHIKAKFRGLSSEDQLQLLTNSDSTKEITSALLTRVQGRLSEVRRQHFRKPVASLPFGLTLEHAETIAKLHPELREITYEPDEAVPEGVFQGCEHLAVRRCLLQLLSIDSSITDDPYAQRIYLGGITLQHHSFVWRTQVPCHPLPEDIPKDIERFYVVIDACQTKIPIDQSLKQLEHKQAAETLVISPYDSTMWTHRGGRVATADYVFEWGPPGITSSFELVKPTRLPSSFFSREKFANWSLYIQPANASHGYKFTRQQFLMLHGGVGVDAFFETRIVRCGFAETSYIAAHGQPTQAPSLEEVIARATGEASVPPGMVRIPKRPADGIREQMTLGRQYDLYSDYPSYVRTTYLDAAYRQFMTLKVGRHIIAAMMRSLHTNAAKLVYNGAIVTAETMVDVETMCSVLEYVVNNNIRAKMNVAAITNMARLPANPTTTDYAQSIFGWASHMALTRVTPHVGAQKVKDYLTYLSHTDKPTQMLDDDQYEADEGLQYSEPQPMIADKEKQELTDMIERYATDVFGYHFNAPYELTRADLQFSKRDVFQLRRDLASYEKQPISIESVQLIYDDVFPGNSMIIPTANQMANERGDFSFTIDVQYFKMVIPAMFTRPEELICVPSKLRTSVGADLATSSFRSLMGSLMKRNFNRPRPEAPGDRRLFVQMAVEQVLANHGHKRNKALRSYYAANPIVISRNVIELWSKSHTTADVLAAATLIEGGLTDPSTYRLMPKDVPKPAMSLTAQGQVAVGQTVVYHSKDIISLTAGVFTLALSRLLTYFDNNVRFAFGADEHTSGEWADRYLTMPGVYITEIDVPKFDKTQDWACYELILRVLELVGVDPDVVEFWRRASEKATIFSSLFHLTFTTMFGNRSGNAGTLATNCIVLLFAYLSSFTSAQVVAILIKGDDSVLVTRTPLREDSHVKRLYNDWGFSMKIVNQRGGVTSFCSSFFVKDQYGHYQLVRDVLRVIEKLGRALGASKPASYFLDYYVAVVDTAITYQDDILVANLQRATSIYYGKMVDVKTLVEFIRYISSSSRTFLSVMYGISPEQVTNLEQIDDAIEVLSRTKSDKFVKAKQLADGHNVVRLSLIDKMKMSSDWIFD